MTLHEIAGRLDDRYRFLVSWRRVSPARHQTLKQAIDWSFDLLSATDQAFFAKLAVFAVFPWKPPPPCPLRATSCRRLRP